MTVEEQRESAALPRTERPDAPAYLTRHRMRRAETPPALVPSDENDESVPLYLRRFRRRDHRGDPVLDDGNVIGSSRAWAEVTRTKEIVPERRDQLAAVDCDVYLVRHGDILALGDVQRRMQELLGHT